MEEDRATVELQLDSELLKWFEEYCRDGGLEIDDELVAIVEQYMDEQVEEAIDSGKFVLDDGRDDVETFDDYQEDLSDEM
jgi:hypothetical protein